MLGCGELLPLEMAQYIRHLCGSDRYDTGAMRDWCRAGASAISQAEHIKALQMATNTSVATTSKWDSDFASL